MKSIIQHPDDLEPDELPLLMHSPEFGHILLVTEETPSYYVGVVVGYSHRIIDPHPIGNYSENWTKSAHVVWNGSVTLSNN